MVEADTYSENQAELGLYCSYLFLYTPVDSGWSSEVSNNVPAIINASSFLIIVFMHTKKPNMVNYIQVYTITVPARVLKLACPKNNVGDVWQPIFMTNGTQTWCILSHADNSASFRQKLSKHMK